MPYEAYALQGKNSGPPQKKASSSRRRGASGRRRDTCFALLGIADRRRILAVGDSLRTDIAGAATVGIDSVLVAGSIHGEEFGIAEHEMPDLERLAAGVAASGHRLTAVIARFRW
jgi:ribonucleotide monophosphatase NagD (HAD superfamily)